MGSIEGFITEERLLPETRDPKERTGDYKELYKPYDDKLTIKQASRCMDCGVPFCHNGCPLGNNIPDFNDAVYNEDWAQALDILLATNNFPEFTGRICPAPCEGSCVLGINKPPVAIEHIEKSIVEKGFELGLIKASPPTARNGKAVAIIGSGPAGLAAADQLNKEGFTVTVYERDPKPGGLLRFGIPDFKLDKSVVERRIALMEEEGVEFKLNCELGKDVSVEYLKRYDSILLAIGSTVPRDLAVTGRELDGIHFAMDFLTQQNRKVSDLPVEGEKISAKDKNVIVIGGGDTGSDCIGTSNRQGAKSILQFEIMDKPPTERGAQNPWPEWPMILRTSTSHEEGADREWSVMTKEFLGENGRLKSLKTVKIQWEDGRPVELPGTEEEHPCELVLLAMGFLHPQKEGLLTQLGVSLDGRGNIVTKGYETSEPNIYAAGDTRRGQSLVVWAISEGREAARMIARKLTQSTLLPSKDVAEYSL